MQTTEPMSLDATQHGTTKLYPSRLATVHHTKIASPALVQGLDEDFYLPIDDAEAFKRSKRAYFKKWSEYQSASELYGVMRHRGHVAIVGAGPSLMDDIETVRMLGNDNVVIIALNNAHDILLDAGIKPDLCMVIESKERASRYFTPQDEIGYLIGTVVSDATLEVLRPFAKNTYLFHVMLSDAHREFCRDLNKRFPKRNLPAVSGGTSVGVRCFDFVTGFLHGSVLHFFGFDSSGTPKKMHARTKEFGVVTPSVPAQLLRPDGRAFKRLYPTTKAMMRQAGEFWDIVNSRAIEVRAGKIRPFEVIVHGRGLLPDWAACFGFHINSAAIVAELEAEGYDENYGKQTVEEEPKRISSEALDAIANDLAGLAIGGGAEAPSSPLPPIGAPVAGRVGSDDGSAADHDQQLGEPQADGAS